MARVNAWELKFPSRQWFSGIEGAIKFSSKPPYLEDGAVFQGCCKKNYSTGGFAGYGLDLFSRRFRGICQSCSYMHDMLTSKIQECPNRRVHTTEWKLSINKFDQDLNLFFGIWEHPLLKCSHATISQKYILMFQKVPKTFVQCSQDLSQQSLKISNPNSKYTWRNKKKIQEVNSVFFAFVFL